MDIDVTLVDCGPEVVIPLQELVNVSAVGVRAIWKGAPICLGKTNIPACGHFEMLPSSQLPVTQQRNNWALVRKETAVA
eukprot:6167640-Amphidinium_carterae.1